MLRMNRDFSIALSDYRDRLMEEIINDVAAPSQQHTAPKRPARRNTGNTTQDTTRPPAPAARQDRR